MYQCAILNQSYFIQNIVSFDHDRFRIRKKKKEISIITRFSVLRDGCYWRR